MPEDFMMYWNGLLTLFLGLVGWVIKTFFEEQRSQRDLIHRTREDYVKKSEHVVESEKVLEHLIRLENKIDRLSQSRRLDA
jgi:hypothetical protein